MTTSDRDQLVRLLHDYADAVRAGAEAGAEAWAATWVDDATWELPGRSVVGKADIVATWDTSIRKQAHVVQFYGSAWFDVDGDTATGRVQLIELVRGIDGVGSTLVGHYDDAYRRTADGWRFTSRRLTIAYRGAPDLSGTFAT